MMIVMKNILSWVMFYHIFKPKNLSIMPIIREGSRAREIFQQVIADNKALPCFCTESVYTTEAIFKGAKVYKEEKEIAGQLPLIIAFTASYEDRQQLKNYTGLADFREGLLAVKADIERLAREEGPYAGLDVIVHLDHAQPGQDDWIVEEAQDFISSVMWDCSHYSMQDNMEMMKAFVKKNKNKFIIEGAVDEIYNYSADNERMGVVDNITEPDTAAQYLQETGADLIVANVGTEHRRTEGTVKYHREEARAITKKTGRKLVLHGTSSLKEQELESLASDGFVKVNLWGNLEARPGKKMAETLLKELEHQLATDKVLELINAGYLHPSMQDKNFKPSIHFLTEKYRRDEIYLPEASGIVKRFYEILYNSTLTDKNIS